MDRLGSVSSKVGLGMLLLAFVMTCCSERRAESDLFAPLANLPSIDGTQDYLASPFVAAGDRVYMVGYQDGTFPDLGWHIAGEMGGIWDHPIKLLDGFSADLRDEENGNVFCLNNAVQFTNYPIGNVHHFVWTEEHLRVDRFQFAPDGIEGMVVSFRIRNDGEDIRKLSFSFTGMADLRPTWLGERTNMIDGRDTITFDPELHAFIAKDVKNPWYAVFGTPSSGATISSSSSACGIHTGADATLATPLTLAPGEQQTLRIIIAGSSTSKAEARETYRELARTADSALAAKIDRYATIDRMSHATLPDKKLGQMYQWLKFNCQWLARCVPAEGTGIGAGLPDYPWWFGADMSYALQGVLASGNHALARKSVLLLHALSRKENGNGRIIHEASTNGAVYNPGNVNETAQYISLLATYLSWTGDTTLIRSLYPDIRSGISWLLKTRDPDGNGYPNGSGMMEIAGLNSEMIDVVVYTAKALEDAAEVARILGDSAAARTYAARATDLTKKINREWWNEAMRSFADFRATPSEAKPIVDAAIVRADTLHKPWAVSELKEIRRKLTVYPPNAPVPHVVYHNWVVNTPMETGLADVDKARLALETAKKYENAFGVFVTGIDRTEEPDSVVLRSRKKTFSYTGAVMTLPTGVLAVAAARYGTPEDVLRYLEKLKRSFSYALPGSMYEVSPDFGMVTQAWNIYGVAVPIVNFLFGIHPSACEKTVTVSPHLPASWNEASLENIPVGNNTLSLYYTQKDNRREYRILQKDDDWTIVLNLPKATRIIVNGQERRDSQAGPFMLKGREINVQLYQER